MAKMTRYATAEEKVAAVKAHALANYEAGGWDVIVECWSDEDIARDTAKCRTEAGAIKHIGTLVGIYAERQADAVNSAF